MSTADRSLLSSVLLDHFLLDDNAPPFVHDRTRLSSDWVTMPCARHKDYVGDGLLEGFTLMARLAVPPRVSQMRLRVTEAVIRAKGHIYNANILSADKDLMLIYVNFQHYIEGYYIIYDASDASLSMVHHPQESNPGLLTRHTTVPLVIRRCNGAYTLVYLAAMKNLASMENCLHDRLCVWPPLHQLSLPSSSRFLPWCLKVPIYPKEMPAPCASGFFAQKVFSFQGKAFWADLMRGILYCKLTDLLYHRPNHVPFHFISLPPDCSCPDTDCSVETFQTMGFVGGSIKFASLSSNLVRAAMKDIKVTIWTLMPSLQGWKKDGELLLGDLFKQQEFVRAGGLPPSARYVMTPLVSLHPQDDGDVLLYLLVGECYPDEERRIIFTEQRILCIDMQSKRLHSSERLPSSCYFFRHRLDVSDFFEHLASKHLPSLAIACPAQEDVAALPLKRNSSPMRSQPSD